MPPSRSPLPLPPRDHDHEPAPVAPAASPPLAGARRGEPAHLLGSTPGGAPASAPAPRGGAPRLMARPHAGGHGAPSAEPHAARAPASRALHDHPPTPRPPVRSVPRAAWDEPGMAEAAEDVVARPSKPDMTAPPPRTPRSPTETAVLRPRARELAARILAALVAGCSAACDIPMEPARACVAFHDCYDPADPCAVHACEQPGRCRVIGHDQDHCGTTPPPRERPAMNTTRALTIPVALALCAAACCCDHDGTPLPELPTDKPDAETCGPPPPPMACLPGDSAFNAVVGQPCETNIDCDAAQPCIYAWCGAPDDPPGAATCQAALRPDGAWCGDGWSCDEGGTCCPEML